MNPGQDAITGRKAVQTLPDEGRHTVISYLRNNLYDKDIIDPPQSQAVGGEVSIVTMDEDATYGKLNDYYDGLEEIPDEPPGTQVVVVFATPTLRRYLDAVTSRVYVGRICGIEMTQSRTIQQATFSTLACAAPLPETYTERVSGDSVTIPGQGITALFHLPDVQQSEYLSIQSDATPPARDTVSAPSDGALPERVYARGADTASDVVFGQPQFTRTETTALIKSGTGVPLQEALNTTPRHISYRDYHRDYPSTVDWEFEVTTDDMAATLDHLSAQGFDCTISPAVEHHLLRPAIQNPDLPTGSLPTNLPPRRYLSPTRE